MPKPVYKFHSYLGVLNQVGEYRLIAGPYFGSSTELARNLANSQKRAVEKWAYVNVVDWQRYYDFGEWVMATITYRGRTIYSTPAGEIYA